jgi:hypothetical protein
VELPFYFQNFSQTLYYFCHEGWSVSDAVERGSLYVGIISLKRAFITYHAFFVYVE